MTVSAATAKGNGAPVGQATPASRLADEELRDRYGKWLKNLIWIARKEERKNKAERERRRSEVMGRQRELRRATGSGPKATAAWLRTQLRLQDSETLPIEAPGLPRPLTADEFIQPPFELEREIGLALAGNVTRRDAARPWFWLLCHIAWLERGDIRGNVRRAFCWSAHAAGNVDERGQLEAETRNFLRRTGGIERVRGKVSVLSDCPLARAWWRYRLALNAACMAGDGRVLTPADAHRGLAHSGAIWEALVGLGVKRLTVINHDRARAAIVSTLARVVSRAAPDGRIDWEKQDVARAAQELGREALGRSLANVEWSELCRIVEKATRSQGAPSPELPSRPPA